MKKILESRQIKIAAEGEKIERDVNLICTCYRSYFFLPSVYSQTGHFIQIHSSLIVHSEQTVNTNYHPWRDPYPHYNFYQSFHYSLFLGIKV